MRSGQIQYAIANGMSPFALCHQLTREVRRKHRSSEPIQRSIGNVIQSLGAEVVKPVARPEVAAPVETLKQAAGGVFLWPECF